MAETTTERSKDLLALLSDLSTMATANKTLELLEEIAENQDNPNYTPPTFRELFGTHEGINVFGELFPPDMEALADERVEAEWLKGPVRAILTNKRRLTKGAEQLHKAQEDLKLRARRKARAAVRKTPGGTKRTREFLQTLAVRDLHIFSAGTPHNRLVFGKRTRIELGVLAPLQQFDLSDEMRAAQLAGDSDGTLHEAFSEEQLRHFEGLVLDHSNALGMAVGTVIGHDRIERVLDVQISYREGGTNYTAHRSTLNGRAGKVVHGGFLAPDDEEQLEELGNGAALVEVKLVYKFFLAKARIDDAVEMLQLISGQPIYRGMALDLDEDDEEFLPVAAGGNLDDLLNDDVEDEEDAPIGEPDPALAEADGTPEGLRDSDEEQRATGVPAEGSLSADDFELSPEQLRDLADELDEAPEATPEVTPDVAEATSEEATRPEDETSTDAPDPEAGPVGDAPVTAEAEGSEDVFSDLDDIFAFSV